MITSEYLHISHYQGTNSSDCLIPQIIFNPTDLKPMAKILKKPWKSAHKKTPTALLSLEQQHKFKEEKKAKAEQKKRIIDELRRKKREYFDTLRKKQEEKKLKKQRKINLLQTKN